MKILNHETYYLLDNFEPLEEAKELFPGSVIRSITCKKLVDIRTNTVILRPVYDLKGLLNYMSWVASLCNSMEHSYYTLLTEMLDSGYFPLIMPPHENYSDIILQVVNKCKELGFNLLIRKSISLKGFSLDFGEDYWISKIEVYTILGIHPIDVSVTKVLNLILKNGGVTE